MSKNEEKYDNSSEVTEIKLEDIKDAIENKLSNGQKKKIIKENAASAIGLITMLFLLYVIYMGNINIQHNMLITDLKALSLGYAVIGIIVLESSYKRDNVRMALSALEVIAFGVINVSMAYVIDLNVPNLANVIIRIAFGVVAYYIIKMFTLIMRSVKKYKKENSDIKDIVAK